MNTESIANEIVNDLALPGCRPEPLAHYLKALGVLRMVAEQKDDSARGYWKDDVFHLVSRLDREGLLRFFLEEYEPTPVVAPWNGGSGFHPKDNQDAIKAIRKSDSPRFSMYRKVIELADIGLEKVGRNQKEELLAFLRAFSPESALSWLDAVVVLSTDGPKYPPLLGTGGNDVRLDFTNNFMQHLLDSLPLVQDDDPPPMAGERLSHALFDHGRGTVVKDKSMGQFFPGCIGANPWDFVLMIEGALVFGAAAVKRLESGHGGAMACPFTVEACSTGFPSGKANEDSRGETWIPLWRYPASMEEIRAVFAEGRSIVGKRPSVTGLDFARSVATLGVDRGIESFVRYGFHERNGRAYLATPLGRWHVQEHPEPRLLQEVDRWLDPLRSATKAKKCPQRIAAMLHQVEEAVFKLCRNGGARRTCETLMALGAAQRACATSLSFCTGYGIPPVPSLDPTWLKAADDGSVEFRLAASIASIHHIRKNVDVVTAGPKGPRWDNTRKPWMVWNHGNLVDNLAAIMLRRAMDARRKEAHGDAPYPLSGRRPAALSDIALFLDQQVDDGRIRKLFLGLCLIDWRKVDWQPHVDSSGRLPDVRYGLLKLCFLSDQGRRLLGISPEEPAPIPVEPSILHRLASGDLSGAVRLSCRRLAACGLVPRSRYATGTRALARRMLAALLFPIPQRESERLLAAACLAHDEAEAA